MTILDINLGADALTTTTAPTSTSSSSLADVTAGVLVYSTPATVSAALDINVLKPAPIAGATIDVSLGAGGGSGATSGSTPPTVIGVGVTAGGADRLRLRLRRGLRLRRWDGLVWNDGRSHRRRVGWRGRR